MGGQAGVQVGVQVGVPITFYNTNYSYFDIFQVIVTPGHSVKKVLVAPALKLKAAPGEVWLQS